ncbi:tRNA pseudouridine(55) synthase TruB [Allofrancisella guangzhouensis]|uniref:tRNA pseudouridine synthase B n=1 Tax=Allofrancisella guangzhouensis TaxID=594679 RepID=A0A0A8E5S8_9GAMM|nr:tRNA pseudouridine(55) synthase TruB [Allofrancisella guangzhouensis]AJC49368.1 pseudouridine synthase [Allofrancisella guangzhouensis]MBK2026991.1 tRNA pseudouridine(55) synthase TruB [Allofrancisella guangzhouensis]MBK2043899.1 tRNA pseudouridine(55) synthase TruB [Allofrancisella guangzhouensis]MBK2044988.1 tRNA pseudouridine(55) synthase TruB [Allofrancisella guangzhouensis]
MKKNKLNLNGIIIINKSKGVSSNKILQQLKYLYNAKKAGHTGTLDPMATGVLPICFGRATKIAQYLLDADKEYIATIKLGIQTTTGDAEGEVVTTQNVPKLSNMLIENILDKFRGQIDQTPPIYSALKHNGQPLYKLAREGKQVEIRPRKVTIYELKLLNSTGDTLEIKVRCSKGTYIRSLAMDIGKELDCGGSLIALQRIQSGPFSLDKAYQIEDLKNLSFEEKLDTIENIESVFKDKPIYTLGISQKYDLYNKGILITRTDISGVFRIYDNNKFVAIAEFDKGNLISKKFFEQEKLISE